MATDNLNINLEIRKELIDEFINQVGDSVPSHIVEDYIHGDMAGDMFESVRRIMDTIYEMIDDECKDIILKFFIGHVSKELQNNVSRRMVGKKDNVVYIACGHISDNTIR